MAKEKTINYTPEMTAEIISAYVAGETVENIAARIGKTTRSIVAKLSREGVYKAKAYTRKDGSAVAKKDTVADAIGEALSMTEADITSLSKANRSALLKLCEGLRITLA